ncbi:MAG: hypothetical protein ABI741_00915 [Ferruginibacter sp.]
MKTLLLSFGLLFFGLLVRAQSDNSFKLSEEASKELIQSREYQTLIKFQHDFLDIISDHVNKGVSLEFINTVILDAIKTNNYKEVYQMLFSDYESGDAFFISWGDAKRALLTKNLFIEKHMEVFTCKTCHYSLSDQANFFLKNFPFFDKNRYPGTTSLSGKEALPCGSYWNQVKLGVCATACGLSTAGIGIGLCGWGCWCAFCSQNSSTANIICAN